MAACVAALMIGVPSLAGGTFNNAILHTDSSVVVSDTLRGHVLKDVDVLGKRVGSHLTSVQGVDIIDMELLDNMPRILGNADPIHYAQLLPGVQTNSEYDAGIHIHGCDNSHNHVSIDGVPLYGVAHLLGFFSIFNGSHFSGMSIMKSPVTASSPNRLGGVVSMSPGNETGHIVDAGADEGTGVLHGDLSVGPMSSQGTLHIPAGSRSCITLSARESYLNILYSGILKMDEDRLKYAFGDYNISLNTEINKHNTLSVEAYWGHDNAEVLSDGTAMDTHLKWNNYMVSVRLDNVFKNATASHRVYFTGYDNDFFLSHADFNVGLESWINDIGYRSDFFFKGISAGMEFISHNMQPQNPSVSGTVGNEILSTSRQHSFESVLYASYLLDLGNSVSAEAGVRLTAYRKSNDSGSGDSGGKTFWSADPGLSVKWRRNDNSSYSLNAGVRHQYLFQTGFSSIGLPTEYWFSSDGNYRPQYSFNISFSSDNYLSGRSYRLSAELYYKRLFHQIENTGNVFDLIYSTYSPDMSIIRGNGYNYGVNVLLEKRKGTLTGWMSYSFGRAWRRYPGTVYKDRYPASHERIHEMNVVGTYKIGRRWSMGGMFVLASGTPYTKVEHFYLLAGNILADYGPHNGNRLRPYMRLDLSVNYGFPSRSGRKSGINLSLYNVTMHKNDLFYRLKVTKGNTVVYSPLRFVMPILPSVNYYYRF